jgi:triacylglycerol esterase/lipase EstA (alpha/beta hydrolase family)
MAETRHKARQFRLSGRAATSAVALVGLVASCAIAAVALPGRAEASQLPVVYNGVWGYTHASRAGSPPGANNWSCKPTSAHPRPVVLVHGTFGDMSDSWQALSPLLFDNGYCVFALDYGPSGGSDSFGVYATGEISRSAEQLSAFVDTVLTATGADQVDIVGHSQGGMMPRYYLKYLGGAAKVHTLVGLAPSNHGTTFNGLLALAAHLPAANRFVGSGCEACAEQEAGSAFLDQLNQGGDTVANVRYTVIESAYDEVVTPYTSAFLSGPNVTNILLQRQCSLDYGEHLSMPYDHIADTDVLNALDPLHPRTVDCYPVAPVSGG